MSKRRMTSTKNIAKIITSGMATVNHVSIQERVSSDYMEVFRAETGKFVESIIMLDKTLFSDMLDWKYEKQKIQYLESL